MRTDNKRILKDTLQFFAVLDKTEDKYNFREFSRNFMPV